MFKEGPELFSLGHFHLSEVKNSKEGRAAEIGRPSESEYIILIIFHLSGSWNEVIGDSDKSRDG